MLGAALSALAAAVSHAQPILPSTDDAFVSPQTTTLYSVQPFTRATLTEIADVQRDVTPPELIGVVRSTGPVEFAYSIAKQQNVISEGPPRWLDSRKCPTFSEAMAILPQVEGGRITPPGAEQPYGWSRLTSDPQFYRITGRGEFSDGSIGLVELFGYEGSPVETAYEEIMALLEPCWQDEEPELSFDTVDYLFGSDFFPMLLDCLVGENLESRDCKSRLPEDRLADFERDVLAELSSSPLILTGARPGQRIDVLVRRPGREGEQNAEFARSETHGELIENPEWDIAEWRTGTIPVRGNPGATVLCNLTATGRLGDCWVTAEIPDPRLPNETFGPWALHRTAYYRLADPSAYGDLRGAQAELELEAYPD